MASLPNSRLIWKALADFVERGIPGDALPARICAFGADAAHRVENAVRRVDPLQILGDFGAQEAARHRMAGVALDPGGAAILHRDEHTARVRTIMRTRGVNDALHGDRLYPQGSTQYPVPSTQYRVPSTKYQEAKGTMQVVPTNVLDTWYSVLGTWYSARS